MRVYVSGPYTHGDPLQNVKTAMAVAGALLDVGHAPYVPHLSHFLHLHQQRSYEDWMTLDLAYLAVCEALIRIPGFSPGADREVAEAERLRIPVYSSVEEFLGALAVRGRPQDYMTITEAAGYLGVHVFTVRRLVKYDRPSVPRLPALLYGGKYLIRRDLLERFAKAYDGRVGRRAGGEQRRRLLEAAIKASSA